MKVCTGKVEGMKLKMLYLVNLIYYINETVTLNNVTVHLKLHLKQWYLIVT